MSDAHEAERAAAREAEDLADPTDPALDDDRPTQAELADDEPVDAEVADAVENATAAAALVVTDPQDTHEGIVAMEAHEARAFIERLTRQAQEGHLAKRWVYRLPGGGGEGLTGDAVEDLVQQMNWTGRCRIGVMPETLDVQRIEGDEDGEPMHFWMATVGAVDGATGQVHMGTAMEPERMKLKAATANAKRDQGKPISEDNRVFNRFAPTVAVNKAERNALEKHIPTEVKQHLLAMAARNPNMVERVQTEAEVAAAALPPPVTGPEADALRKSIEACYLRIRALGGGKGAQALPPGRYRGSLDRAGVSLVDLRAMLGWLEGREKELAAHFAEGSS